MNCKNLETSLNKFLKNKKFFLQIIERVLYTIRVDNEFINLREDIDLTREPIRKVYKDEKYQVVEYYEGNAYNWYRVIYDEDKTGWLASGKTKSWVIVEN